ncbi:hypothetical protein TIFTF001_034691 [Ficus carica]|uniref:Uncharacterized protein n=1 Tax=Ficus carica TaxID=3494 RepID=A0AA88E3D3_FICCA|nr:hypothetical protein TIFTF001_034674 [Ficus carica]GMN65635.1 hypothetical protein TIFTF001_034691 [Ficus carica]
MVATITASYFLLTADYGPEPNALDHNGNGLLMMRWISCAYTVIEMAGSAPCFSEG